MLPFDDQSPLVAVVTPVYNGAQYLAETMACVQAQDYPNLVHVVLDNASTDATPEIIRSFEHQRVPLVVSRNPRTLPMGENFNAALTLIPPKARYFRVLCADDLMAASAISRKVLIANSNPAVTVVGCRCRHVELFGAELPPERAVFDGRSLVRAYLRGETRVVCGTHLLFRTGALDGARSFFDEKLTCDDTDAALREVMKGDFGFVHEELAFFRNHAQGDSARVHAEGTSLFEWLVLLDRYGPLVLPAGEYRRDRARHRRRLLRRAMLKSVAMRDMSLWRRQKDRLSGIDDPVEIAQIGAAIGEWLYLLVSGRRGKVIRAAPQL